VSSSVLYMSMSLDGYIAGPNDEPGNPGGDDFMRLHEWYFADGESGRPSGPAGELVDQMTATGAVLVGPHPLPRPPLSRPASPCRGKDNAMRTLA
jgi:hypothetical protein